MKRKFTKKKIFRDLIITGMLVYVVCVLINQQKTLNSYKNTQKYYEEQIEKAEKYNEELVAMKENVTSEEYIEQIAREKLDMYLPNERVYIDVGK